MLLSRASYGSHKERITLQEEGELLHCVDKKTSVSFELVCSLTLEIFTKPALNWR